jgi:GNAT superfamily N-acetyltransferase
MPFIITDPCTTPSQPQANINVLWKVDCAPNEISAARGLIERVHYQDGKADGGFVVGFADLDEVNVIAPNFAPSAISGKQCLVGVAVIRPGISYASPVGRRDLAAKCFPQIDLAKLTRGEAVRQMGLALISRVVVEPDLHGRGIGRALASECRKKAASIVPGSRYVEVMTSQRLSDAEFKKQNAEHDFLQAAGFQLAPYFTKVAKHRRRDRRDRSLYYWAPVIT